MRRTTVITVGLGLAAPPGDVPVAATSVPALIYDQWQILKMATAHGVFTIEVELADLDAAAVVARLLVETLIDDYAEVLVYMYAGEHGVGGHAASEAHPVHSRRWIRRAGVLNEMLLRCALPAGRRRPGPLQRITVTGH